MANNSILGPSESLRGAFDAAAKAKRMVTISLLTGKNVAGVPVGSPTDTFVVVRPSGGDDGSFDVLVMYQAIASLTVYPQ